MFSTTIVLHPRYKLRYFEKQEFDEGWIKAAEKIVIDEFKRRYSDYVIPKKLAPRSVATKKKATRRNNDSESDHEIFSSGMSSDEDEFVSELDRYLSAPRVKDVEDPLAWWYGNRGTYPRLWRMARDYLTIPGVCKLNFSSTSILTCESCLSQLLPSPLNVYSARDDSSCPTSAIGCPLIHPGLCCASGPGPGQATYKHQT